jgi:hypothetical protein
MCFDETGGRIDILEFILEHLIEYVLCVHFHEDAFFSKDIFKVVVPQLLIGHELLGDFFALGCGESSLGHAH